MRSKTTHATGFSQWLMANLVALPLVGDGCLIAVGDKPRRYLHHFVAVLPVTNRYSPFAVILARQEPRPPILLPSLAPRPSSRFGLALRFFRHQLRAKARSMGRKFWAFRTHFLIKSKFYVSVHCITGVQYSPYLRTSSMTRQYCSKLTVGGTEWSLW